MSAQHFMEFLFGKLPELFSEEYELTALWSDPDTRAKLLEGLAEKNFGREQMAEMQLVINAEKAISSTCWRISPTPVHPRELLNLISDLGECLGNHALTDIR